MRWSCAILCLLISGGVFCAQERKIGIADLEDFNTPVVPPLQKGKPCPNTNGPDLKDILQALPRRTVGMANQFEVNRQDFAFVAEKTVDRVNPPRFYPLFGRAQLHQVHWKCTVQFMEITKGNLPFPFMIRKRRSEVVFVDKDHLHLLPIRKNEK